MKETQQPRVVIDEGKDIALPLTHYHFLIKFFMTTTNTMKGIGMFALMLTAVFIGTTVSVLAAPSEKMGGATRGERKEFRQDLSEDQIETLEAARELHEDGEKEAARELLQDAGIETPRQEMRQDNKEQHEAVRDAIESEDYDAFQEATESFEIEIELSEDQFEGMIEVKELKQSGDFEAAKELAKELELPKMGKKAHKQFQQDLTDGQKETMKDVHELIKNGDKDAAQELLQANDIEFPQKRGFFKRLFSKKT